MTHTILRIDASARRTGSVSRDLLDRIVSRFGDDTTVITRDLAEGLPFLNEEWVGATFTPSEQRSAAQNEVLSLSDTLIEEVKAADTLLFGIPMYNFGVPATLKAWIDQIARVGVTFRYTEAGPVGQLTGKRAIVAFASGGAKAGSEFDFATGYMRHMLAFIGITDVEFVLADGMSLDAEGTIAAALEQVEKLDIAA